MSRFPAGLALGLLAALSLAATYNQVAPTPMLAKTPTASSSCSMPQGGAGCCVAVTTGDPLRLGCDADTACHYRGAEAYPDAGFTQISLPDAGTSYALPSDILLPAQMVESATAPRGLVSAVCAYDADGGVFQAVSRYP